LTEELEQERERRLEAKRWVEQQVHLPQLLQRERGRLADGLEQERAKRLKAQRKVQQEREGWERERSARQQAEQRADRLERELQNSERTNEKASRPTGRTYRRAHTEPANLCGKSCFPCGKGRRLGRGGGSREALLNCILPRQRRRRTRRSNRRTKSQNAGCGCRTPTTSFLRLFLERRDSSSRAEKTSAQPIARPEQQRVRRRTGLTRKWDFADPVQQVPPP
jgi:hypothetical protein